MSPETLRSSLRERSRAGAIHLGISAAIAALSALVVFFLWYPAPFRELSGGRELFLLLVSVDVVLGPLVTFSIFSRKKAWPVLRRDLAIIGVLQLAALAYGMYTAFVARPVYVAFEYDRFRVVHAIEIPRNLLPQAPAGMRMLPLFGPRLLALREFASPDEKYQMTLQALEGLPLGARPELWEPYFNAVPKVLAAARPLAPLRQRFPDHAAAIDRAVRASGRPVEQLVYAPVIGRKTFWTALLDKSTGEIVGYVPLDPY
jgi:hypothetical protein